MKKKSRILVMDDDPVILTILSAMIKKLGHELTETTHGQEVLLEYQKAIQLGAPFDVVILDLNIRGGMGGGEAAIQLKEIDPKVRMIISSGYVNNPIMTDYKKYGFMGRVAKPYSFETLRIALDEVLAG